MITTFSLRQYIDDLRLISSETTDEDEIFRRRDEEEQVLNSLLQVKADFTSAAKDESIRIRYAADREHLMEGLQKAGLEA